VATYLFYKDRQHQQREKVDHQPKGRHLQSEPVSQSSYVTRDLPRKEDNPTKYRVLKHST